MLYVPFSPLKQCSKCGASKLPAEFFRNRANPDGLFYWCKDCDAIRRGVTRRKQERFPKGYKRCTQCNEVKPLSQFTKESKTGNTRRSRCKSCNNAYERDRNKRNPDTNRAKKQRYWSKPNKREKARAYSRAAYHAKKCERNQYMHDWRIRNRKSVLDYAKRYANAHREQNKIARRRRYAEAPEVFRRQRHIRRARVLGAQGSHTAQEIRAQYNKQQGKCFWCSKVLDAPATIDHVIPLSRGGSNDITNIVIACRSCNSRKRTKLPYTEWIPPNPLKLED